MCRPSGRPFRVYSCGLSWVGGHSPDTGPGQNPSEPQFSDLKNGHTPCTPQGRAEGDTYAGLGTNGWLLGSATELAPGPMLLLP